MIKSESLIYLGNKEDYYKYLFRIGDPFIKFAKNGGLRKSMPLRGIGTYKENHSHLEAVARWLVGLAPALELQVACKDNVHFQDLSHDVRELIGEITDPLSSNKLNFETGTQPLVDTAFLAQAFLRAPKALWERLPERVKGNAFNCFSSSRNIRPHFNNWLLFSAMIEAFLCSIGEPWDRMRVDYALRQHQQWYVGDGTYGDGAEFHWDYYNSFVILPMLLDILDAVQGQHSEWDRMRPLVLLRAQRHAEVLERIIGPDGSYPLIGRSLAYRCGFLHVLAQLAWQQRLPASLNPGAVRAAMWAVIEKTLGRAENYDENGWLQIGINGHQPGVGENYISTGSLYLCSVAFLPLGLEESAPFWSLPEKPWTQRACFWLGQDMTLDKALK